jgi:hypothetical protein
VEETNGGLKFALEGENQKNSIFCLPFSVLSNPAQ